MLNKQICMYNVGNPNQSGNNGQPSGQNPGALKNTIIMHPPQSNGSIQDSVNQKRGSDQNLDPLNMIKKKMKGEGNQIFFGYQPLNGAFLLDDSKEQGQEQS